MSFQDEVERTAAPTSCSQERLVIAALGIAGEAGEIVDEIKKAVFHKHGLDRQKLIVEAGDLCWYVARLANELDVTLEEIFDVNIAKLAKRYPNGFTIDASKNRAL